jgi:hypothetical protein
VTAAAAATGSRTTIVIVIVSTIASDDGHWQKTFLAFDASAAVVVAIDVDGDCTVTAIMTILR